MTEKKYIFSVIKSQLEQAALTVSNTDMQRPWGGFFVVDEADAEKFLQHYFPYLDKAELLKGRLSPKILVVAPHKKLSWQYHHRRSEIWKLIEGDVAVITSDTDVEKEPVSLKIGDTIKIKKAERHRLIGLETWGVVAEIWLHTDPNLLSDEEDIVRLLDDFGR